MDAIADTPPGAPEAASGDPFAAAAGENFPVASRLIRRDLRPAVIAFYRFARAADDVADNPALAPSAKLARLDRFASALGGSPGDPHAADLRRALAGHPRAGEALNAAGRLLVAFRQDARGASYPDWAALRAYCAMSADPVGRFLLILHDEAPETQRPSDALCTALQVLNHLQDLRADRDLLGRVYLPSDLLAEAGARPADLSASVLSPAARAAVDRVLDRCDALLNDAEALPGRIRARGLRGQSTATLVLARSLSRRLRHQDPLARRVKAGRGAFARATAAGLWRATWPR